eukprot:CAMPEP_0171228580 /NCGR_PEP_ID=MMETSP0790-20130122/38439_1 /TAXON_ID=2925 /ORGANISM="Alexandrium catenella, Strain OF101" /LENGTH=68 /DNA_ID=CAMNT_0011694735 /DNA_START=82 /DNA_END=284 /DNA_ORIENTATION=+
MGRSTKVRALAFSAVALAALRGLRGTSFVPGPLRRHAAPAAAVSAATMLAPAAFADEIGDASKKLGDA